MLAENKADDTRSTQPINFSLSGSCINRLKPKSKDNGKLQLNNIEQETSHAKS